ITIRSRTCARSSVSHTAAFHSTSLFLFTVPPPTGLYPLSLHDALPISGGPRRHAAPWPPCSPRRPCPRSAGHRQGRRGEHGGQRSEEHTSELQSRFDLVCRLLLEKKKKIKQQKHTHVSSQLSHKNYTDG